MAIGQYGAEAILTNAGATQPGVAYTVNEPGGAASVLFTTLAGTATVANPGQVLDSGGNALFYSAAGPKVIVCGGLSRTVLCVAPSTGVELGFGTTAVNFSMTATLTGIPGLSVPCTVPVGTNVFIEAYLPEVFCNAGVANGFTGGIGGSNVSLFLLEDGVTIASTAITLVVGGFAPLRCALPRAATAGAHTYTAAATCTSGATVTNLTGAGVVPFLRVTAG